MNQFKKQSLGVVRSLRQYLSSQATVLADGVFHESSKPVLAKKNVHFHQTIASWLDCLPSRTCVSNLSQAYSSCVKSSSPQKATLIKREILSMFRAKKYEQVLDLLLRWASSSVNNSWADLISTREMAYFMKEIVRYQVAIISQAADAKNTDHKGHTVRQKFAEARSLREKIRAFYSSLLYGDSHESLYGRSKRADVYHSDNYTGYILTESDYENLITLELGNQKLDLASKWFQRFDSQHENPLVNYTYDLWLLKFKVYCGGTSYLWTSNGSEVNTGDIKRRRGKLASERPWISVFDEYLRTMNRNDNTQPILDNTMNQTLITCMGYSGSMDYLTKFIESMWGITPKGKSKFRLENSDPRFPDLSVLKAIVVSYFHNGRFFEAMGYMNSFQEIYQIDLTGPASKSIWDQVFKYGEFITRYDEDKALTYFLKESRIHVDNKTKKEDKLRKVQADADFDYEGYLTFIKELEQKRTTAMSELWQLYHSSNGVFSTRVIKPYLSYLGIKESTMDQYYELLSYLAKCYHQYAVSPQSFNKHHSMANPVNEIDTSVYTFYEQALSNMIEIKGVLGYIGQIEPLIDEWSLDRKMASNLRANFKSNLHRYRLLLEERRLQMVEEDVKEEEDKFLDLF